MLKQPTEGMPNRWGPASKHSLEYAIGFNVDEKSESYLHLKDVSKCQIILIEFKKATVEGKKENILCEIMQYRENDEIRSKDVFENPS